MEKLLILVIGAFIPGLSNWKLLNNYWATFNLENKQANVNNAKQANVNPKNGVTYKNTCKCSLAKIFWGFVPNPIAGLQSRLQNPLSKIQKFPIGSNSTNWKFLAYTLT